VAGTITDIILLTIPGIVHTIHGIIHRIMIIIRITAVMVIMVDPVMVVEAAGFIAIIMLSPTTEVLTPTVEYQTDQVLLVTEQLIREMTIHQAPENREAIYHRRITLIQEHLL
jgi:hypothetical protein